MRAQPFAGTIDTLVRLLTEYKYAIGSEVDFQDGLAQVLAQHGIAHLREHDLGADYGRIDFYLTGCRIGIELKVKGSPSEVLRQLHRYASSPDIGALVLVTGRSRLAAAPMVLNGKPLQTAVLWHGQF